MELMKPFTAEVRVKIRYTPHSGGHPQRNIMGVLVDYHTDKQMVNSYEYEECTYWNTKFPLHISEHRM